MNLNELGLKYGTDKAIHGYLKYYQEYLKCHDVRSLLEIGCERGNSLRMWREYFPEAILYTLDLFEEFQPPTDIRDLYIIKGSQVDDEILFYLSNFEFTVCIDDGSHNSQDQWITFNALFPRCSLYVVEDLHCCEEEFYRQGLTFDETMLGQMQNGTFPHKFKLHDNKIAFIYK